MLKEFKKFAMRGNVIDMAVGVIMGGAFGQIVSSLVADVLMPLVGVLLGDLDFSQYALALSPNNPDLVLRYGVFIQSIIDFIIIAICIFLMVKMMNKLQVKKEEAEEVAPPADPEDVVLLREIRDLLKNQKN